MPDLDVKDLLRPVGMVTFSKEYFEKKPLFLTRSESSSHEGLFCLADIDRFHRISSPQYTQVFAIDSRRKIATEEFADAHGRVDALRLFKLFEDGATIVYKDADAHFPALATLCRSAEKQFNSRFSVNVYWAPAGGQAFPVHYDANNLFALQISGSKQWRVYQPQFQLPLPDEHCYDALPDENLLAQFTLNAGDMLYVPRGFPHLVSAGDQPSLHITLYSFPYTWAEVIERSVAEALKQDVAFRASIPLGFLGADREALDTAFSGLMKRLAGAVQLKPALDLITRDLLGSRSPCQENPRERIRQAHAISQHSWIKAQKDLLYSIDNNQDAIRLIGQGVEILFDRSALSGLIFALQTPSFQIRELPSPADGEGKLDLVRTLILNGFVSVQ